MSVYKLILGLVLTSAVHAISSNQALAEQFFGDECAGTSIDHSKWDIDIEDPLNAEVTQYNALELHTRKKAETSALVKSTFGAETGVFSFSAFSSIPTHPGNNTPLEVTTRFGLYVNADNRIEFYHKLSGNYMLAYRIVKEGSTVYEAADVAKDFGQFKIIITDNQITAYIWEEDEWILIGESQEQSFLDKKHIFMSTAGKVATKMSMRDCYITDEDFTAATPVAQTSLDAVDARTGGAVPDGKTDCSGAINALLSDGNVVIQNGRFLVSSSILIPSDRTLYIRNATIRLNDGVFDNIFRNRQIFKGDTNVKILGLGNAVLDANGLNNNKRSANYFESVSSDFQKNHKYKRNVGFFGNVSNFEIAGLNEVDRGCYFMTLQDDSYGKIHDIYNSIYNKTQNQDGIQIIYGTHDIELYNISGYFGDDPTSVFLGTVGRPTKSGTLEMRTPTFPHGDVHDIYWHDYHVYYTGCPTIIFICGDGNRIYNCKVENFDVGYNPYFAYFNRGDMYITDLPSADEFFNIHFRDITLDASSSQPQIQFNANMRDISFTNFKNKTKSPSYLVKDTKAFRNHKDVKLNLENVFINGEQITQRKD
ncbi:MAG: glycoside hydrolase family 55 protein [Lentisphaerae bacterium]|nr:glycoside hydrolase family 55 protein [Lentisphaerota bacterium]